MPKTSVVRIPDEVLHRAEEIAVTLGVTRNEVLTRAFTLYMGCLIVDPETGLPVSDTNGSAPQ